MKDKAKSWRIPSASEPGLEYLVTYTPGVIQEWACDALCKGFRFRGMCRHIRLCMNELEAGKLSKRMFEGEEDA